MQPKNLSPTLFSQIRKLNYGESVYLVGSHSFLGEWNIEKSHELSVSEENIWYIFISLPGNTEIEYKYFISDSNKKNLNKIIWKEGFNERLKIVFQEKEFQSDQLNVMSFNIRYENKNDGRHCWENRKTLVTSTIHSIKPDIFCLQESKPSQLSFIANDFFGSYDFYSRGRDFYNTDESCPIFFNRNRFSLLNKGTFWLSDNINAPGSVIKNALFPRIVSWVQLFDFKKKEKPFIFNTHFDHLSTEIRNKNSEILLREIDLIAGINKNRKIIITGDFNDVADSSPIKKIKEKFKDSYLGKDFTFHGFYGNNVLLSFIVGKIDFIFTTEDFRCEEFNILKNKTNFEGKDLYPSDHFPIHARLKY